MANLTVPFIGTPIIALLLRNKFSLVMTIIAVHGEPVENTNQSGIIPIAILKEEVNVEIVVSYI
jgi:hypothetical protein